MNIKAAFLEDFSRILDVSVLHTGTGDLRATVGPEDIFAYIYAILYSPTYRTRYATYHKTEYPRIPFTSDTDMFSDLVALGRAVDGFAPNARRRLAPAGLSSRRRQSR